MNHILLVTFNKGNGNKNYYIVRSPIPIQVSHLVAQYENYIIEHSALEITTYGMIQDGKNIDEQLLIQNNTVVTAVIKLEEKNKVDETQYVNLFNHFNHFNHLTFYELSYPISLSTYEIISQLTEENESFVINIRRLLPRNIFEDVAYIKKWLTTRDKLESQINERWYASYLSLTTKDRDEIFSILTPIEKRRLIIFQLINELPTYLTIEQKCKALLESSLNMSGRTTESVENINRYVEILHQVKQRTPTLAFFNQLFILTLDEWSQRDIDISLEKLKTIDFSNARQVTHVELLPDAHTIILYVYGHGCDSNESFRDLIGPEFYTQINPILLYESPGYECVNYMLDKDDNDLEILTNIVSSGPVTDSVPKLVSHAIEHQAYHAKEVTLYSTSEKSTFEDDYKGNLAMYTIRERIRREKYLLRPGRNHKYEFYSSFNRSIDSIDEPDRATEAYKRSKRGIYLLYHDLPISLSVKENLLHPTSTPYLTHKLINKDIPIIELVDIYKQIHEWYKSTISPDSKLNVLIYDKSCRVPCKQIVPISPPLIRTPSFEASSLGKKQSKKNSKKQCIKCIKRNKQLKKNSKRKPVK